MTPTARLKIKEVYVYTRMQWGQEQAQKYLTMLDNTIQDVAAGIRPTKKSTKFSTRFTFCTAGKHHIFFEQKGDKLTVATIFHTARQVKDHMVEETPDIQREIKQA